MNRFLTKKRAKDGADTSLPRATTETHLSQEPITPAARRTWRKKKAEEAPAKPQLDLITALPSADNFRTSLLMPNLSARFSMLKEQDDPMSILGKASDDSVLDGNRNSRPGAYASLTGGLADIEEVASISDYPRPSLPSVRQASYTYGDGYNTDDESSQNGSIMSRSRPGEGNMLFGGRQKIYRIPIGDHGAVNNLGRADHRGMRGRALYEDDVSMSAFQRMREKEKQLERERQMAMEAEEEKNPQNSPSVYSYSERRDTTSSINSGPSTASASTAPTSIHSHSAASPSMPAYARSNSPGGGVERSRSRRLYEQGLDQHMHDQQSSAMSRLHSIKRESPLNPQSNPTLTSQSQNSPEFRGSLERSSSRPISPFPNAPMENLTTFESIKKGQKLGSPSKKSAAPISPSTEAPTPLTAALNPADRGKATATGEFNRPAGFSEQQYLQRQMSLVQQQQLQREKRKAEEARNGTSPANTLQAVDQIRATPPANPTGRPLPATGGKEELGQYNRGKAKALAHRRGLAARQVDTSPHPSQGTFLAFEDGDDDTDEDQKAVSPPEPSPGLFERPPSPEREETLAAAQPPTIFTHPAMREPSASPTKKEKRRAWSPEALQSAIGTTAPSPINPLESTSRLEATSGNKANGEDGPGLSGLVREHLRHPSNQSSIYPPKSPALSMGNMEFELRTPSMYSTMANPWDHEDEHEPVPEMSSSSAISPRAPTLKELALREAHSPSGLDLERELRRHHARVGSSETQHEREAFANELAERQRTIQENLKIRVGNDRSPSPKGANMHAFESTLKPFGMLRARPSGESVQGKQELPSKAMRMLGISPIESSTTIERSFSEESQVPRSIRSRAMSPANVGRTLHSKMPQTSDEFLSSRRSRRDSNEASRDNSRVRQNSLAGQQSGKWTVIQYSPTGSSRTSSSRNRSSSATSADGAASQARKPSADSAQENERTRSGTSAHISTDTLRSSGDVKANRAPLSLDTNRVPRDGGKESPAPGSYLDRLRESPVTKAPPNPLHPSVSSVDSLSYSVNSTPPITAVSTPNVGNSSPALAKSPHSLPSPQAQTAAGFFSSSEPSSKEKKENRFHRTRKPTILKSEISEPTLIASTSNVDTVDLPAGASLRNGMTDDVDVVLASSVPATSPATAKKTGPSWFHRDRAQESDDNHGKFDTRKASGGEVPKREEIGTMF